MSENFPKKSRREFLTAAAAVVGLTAASNILNKNKNITIPQKPTDLPKKQVRVVYPVPKEEVGEIKKTETQTQLRREYKKPAPGEIIRINEANFEIFPEKLTFKPEKTTLAVSRVWQTATLYDRNGNKIKFKSNKDGNIKPIQFLVGSGKIDSPTPLGFLTVIKHEGVNYRSNELAVGGVARRGEMLGAPMPFAIKIQEFTYNQKGEKVMKHFRGIAVHGRSSVDGRSTRANMSHGCIGVEVSVARLLQGDLKVGDQVLVFDEQVPVSRDGSQKSLIL